MPASINFNKLTQARLLSFVLLLAFVAGCNALHLPTLRPEKAADWLTEGDTALRQNKVHISLDPPLVEAWVYNAGAGFGAVSPLLLGKYVLAGTRKGEVHAIDLETGKKVGIEGFGEALEGTPVIGDRRLFVATSGRKPALKAFNLRRGTEQWKVEQIPDIEAGLFLNAGTLVAVDVESTIRAFEAKTGAKRWTRKMGKGSMVLAAPVGGADGQIVVASDEGEVVSLNLETGQVQWTANVGAPVYVSPASNGATIFLSTTRGRFVALDSESGKPLWELTLPDKTVRMASPSVGSGNVFFGSTDGVVRALDVYTGNISWTFNAPDAITAPPLVTRNTVYVGSMGRMLYGLDRATGSVRWEQKLKGRVKSAMAARDDALIVLTEPRFVYRFKRAQAEVAAKE